MKITFLGTGTSQGVPVIGCKGEVCRSEDPRDKRLRTSLLVEVDPVILCIDTGPDFRQQMLRAAHTHLDAVLYTHEHADHTAGIDDIRAFNLLQKGDIPLYGLPRVIDALEKRFDYIFQKNPYPGLPRVCVHRFTTEAFSVRGLCVQPIPVRHGKLPISGFRIRNMAYLTDVKSLEPEALRRLRNLDLLIISALRREKPHHAHALLHEALHYIEQLRPGQSYLTHISHEMGLHSAVEKTLPQGVSLAYDQLTLKL